MNIDITAPDFRKNLKDVLHNNTCNVTFTKTDGTERVMHCTLDEFNMPLDSAPLGTLKKLSEDTCRVFDVDKQSWRSFRWDSVTSVVVED